MDEDDDVVMIENPLHKRKFDQMRIYKRKYKTSRRKVKPYRSSVRKSKYKTKKNKK